MSSAISRLLTSCLHVLFVTSCLVCSGVCSDISIGIEIFYSKNNIAICSYAYILTTIALELRNPDETHK